MASVEKVGEMSVVIKNKLGNEELRSGAAIAVKHGWTSDEDNKAIIKLAENPAAGRLVFLPWQAGGKVNPKLGGDKK